MITKLCLANSSPPPKRPPLKLDDVIVRPHWARYPRVLKRACIDRKTAQKEGAPEGLLTDVDTAIKFGGVCTNGNGGQVRVERGSPHDGVVRTLDHDRSFLNVLALHGITTYAVHPPHAERVFNRYVIPHTPAGHSIGKRYKTPRYYNFDYLINVYIPQIIDIVCKDSGQKQISWIGFSLGGMLIYAYLAKYDDSRIKNVITIGSPVSFPKLLFKLISTINPISKTLGFQERALTSIFSENLIPISKQLLSLPTNLLRRAPFNLLYNPKNISDPILDTLFRYVVEPMPPGLEKDFLDFLRHGFVLKDKEGEFDFLQLLGRINNGKRNFLLIYGEEDALATPESVWLAYSKLIPGGNCEIISIPKAGHVDLFLGDPAPEVWKHCAQNLVYWAGQDLQAA